MTVEDRSPVARPSSSRRSWFLFGAILMLAGVLRLNDLGDQDFWFDELWSLLNASGKQEVFLSVPHGVILRAPPRITDAAPGLTAGELWRGMRFETHPPLYFMALHYWRSWVGDGHAALRLPSAICSWLTIVPVALAVRRLSKTSAWLWCAALLAVAAADLEMAQSLRHYAPAGLLVAISFWLLVRWSSLHFDVSTFRRFDVFLGVAYALTLLLAMLTHYMSALPLLGQVVWAALVLRGRSRRAWAASTMAAALAFAVLWGPSMLAQWRHVRESADPVVSLDVQPAWHTPLEFASAPVRLLYPVRELAVDLSALGLGPRRLLSEVRSHSPIVAGLGAILLVLVIRGARRRWGPGLLLFALWFVVPMAVLAAAELATGRTLLHHLRYPYFALPGLAGLIALAAEGLKGRRGIIVLSVLLVTAAAMAFVSYPTRRNPDAAAAAAFVDHNITSRDLIVCDATAAPPYWARYLFLTLNHYSEHPIPAIVLLRADPDEALLREFERFDRLFLIHSWPQMQHGQWTTRYALSPDDSPYFFGIGWFLRLDKPGV